jgi:hypothetical protein
LILQKMSYQIFIKTYFKEVTMPPSKNEMKISAIFKL